MAHTIGILVAHQPMCKKQTKNKNSTYTAPSTIGKVVVLAEFVYFSHALEVSPSGQRVLAVVVDVEGTLFTRVGSSVPTKRGRRFRGTMSGRRGGDRTAM
jgi:hypothetical protein